MRSSLSDGTLNCQPGGRTARYDDRYYDRYYDRLKPPRRAVGTRKETMSLLNSALILRYGTIDPEYGRRLATTPPSEDGPVWMVNLMEYRPAADYPTVGRAG